MTNPKTIRTASIATITSLLVLVAALPAVSADHCHDECIPELEVTGVEVPPAWDPLNDEDQPIYWGWTVVDLVLNDECYCTLEGVRLSYTVVADFPPYGVSTGIEYKQVDDDTWLVHALDWDVYEVTFTAYVYCENGEFYEVSTTWLQRN